MDTLVCMTSALAHRGPDEAGLYMDDMAGLGQTRLSIIDPAGGSQPMHNEDKSLWIVFNGEIFNHHELCKVLQRRGHRFSTACDTEVILHAYEEYGADCVHNFNGQFAFAIWDSQKRKVFLARDRVGICPLHYAVTGGFFVFGSEIKSLMQFPGMPRELDPNVVDQIFTYWTPLPGATVFMGIREIRAGSSLTVSTDSLVEKKYWDVPLYPRDAQIERSVEDISDGLREMLLDSVRLRMRADVPVGSYLSGGLDSTGIVSLVTRNIESDLRTFGIRFEEARFDEGRFQKLAVDFLKVRHSEIAVTNQSIRDSFRNAVILAEKPLLRTAPAPLYLLSGLVHGQGIKVVLTGEGADEFFGGYDVFREALVRTFWSRSPQSPMRSRLISEIHPNIFTSLAAKQAMRRFFAAGLDQVAHPLFSHLPRILTTSRTKQFYSRDFAQSIRGNDPVQQLQASLPPWFASLDTLGKAQYLEIMLFMSNYLLSSQGDRMAMGHAVEVRFPYLDHRLMEFAGRIPSRWKILGISEKHILKKAFKGAVPNEIITRTKHPYRAPIQQSLLDPADRMLVDTYMSDVKIAKVGVFDAAKIRLLINKISAGAVISETEGMALAGTLSTQILHEEYIARRPKIPTIKKFSVCVDKRTF